MARYKRFTFLCDSEERRILAALAKRLERSQSDSVRWLIRKAARELPTAAPVVEDDMALAKESSYALTG